MEEFSSIYKNNTIKAVEFYRNRENSAKISLGLQIVTLLKEELNNYEMTLLPNFFDLLTNDELEPLSMDLDDVIMDCISFSIKYGDKKLFLYLINRNKEIQRCELSITDFYIFAKEFIHFLG